MIEPHLHFRGLEIEATIIGFCDGSAVDFTKTYRRAGPGYESPVDYVGQLSGDANRIVGVWSLLDWNGDFIMLRKPMPGAEVSRKAVVTAKI
jgi:hypothetical protein